MAFRPQSTLALATAAFLFLGADTCNRPEPRDYVPTLAVVPPVTSAIPEYRFGVQPMHPSGRFLERYSMLVDALNAAAEGFRLKLVSAQTEDAYDARVRRKELDVCIVEPHRVLEAEPLGYVTIARAGNRDRIAGVIVVRRDADIQRVVALKGRTVAFPSPTALASTMLVRMFLRDAGFDVSRSATAKYVGTQESALVEVARGDADAAGVSREGWLRFADQNRYLAERMIPKWTTDELPGPAVMVRSDLPRGHVHELQQAFLQLKRGDTGRLALDRAGFSEFRYGEEASYDELWEFMMNYSRAFRTQPRPSSTR